MGGLYPSPTHDKPLSPSPPKKTHSSFNQPPFLLLSTLPPSSSLFTIQSLIMDYRLWCTSAHRTGKSGSNCECSGSSGENDDGKTSAKAKTASAKEKKWWSTMLGKGGAKQLYNVRKRQ